MPRRSWTDDDLRSAIAEARTWADVLRGLGVSRGGSTLAVVRRRVRELDLDAGHVEDGTGGAARRTWTDEQLTEAVARSTNLHQVFRALDLEVGGGSWVGMKAHIRRLALATDHWDPGAARPDAPTEPRPPDPRWPEDDLRAAAEGARSVAQIMRRLGLDPASKRGRRSLLRSLAALGVDVTELPGQAWARGRTGGRRPRRPLEEVLVRDSHVTTSHLRRRLIDEGVLPARCERCRLERWLGEPVPLQLDHIDGDRTNNELTNLRLLCPNCHALTDTYCGRNIGRR